MNQRGISVAIVGAGMGGLAAASTLRSIGLDVQVYEQASQFSRIGAGIQMLPNSMKVLRRIGVEDRVRGFAFAPKSHLNREYTGETLIELPMPEERYGAPYLCMHRADLHSALADVLPADIIHRGKKLVSLEQDERQVTLSFADGTTAQADFVIAAD
ncbi:MAG: FAD-dependent monooxygenase, partial [Chloroflexota bacterium]